MGIKRANVVGTGTYDDPVRPDASDPIMCNTFYNPTRTKCLYSTDPEEITDLNELRIERRGLIARFQPDEVLPGGSVIVQVARAQPSETVRFTLEITGETADVTANANGRLRRTFTVPLTAPEGFYKVNIRGLTSGRECDIYITVLAVI